MHISELAPWHVAEVEDVVHIGDHIPVVVKNIDEQGRLNLSLKDVPGRYSPEDIAAAGERRAREPGSLGEGPGARPFGPPREFRPGPHGGPRRHTGGGGAQGRGGGRGYGHGRR